MLGVINELAMEKNMVCVCVCVCVYAFGAINELAMVCVYVELFMRLLIWKGISYVCVYVCVHVCVSACVHVCVYVCVCMWSHK
jgi:hypothetical protein